MKPMIEAVGIKRRYRNGPRALSGVDLEIDEGARFALLGPNGAGKSTLTRILCTLSRADAGTVRIDGIPLSGNPVQVRRRIGVALQELTIDPDSTVVDQLRFQGRLFGIDARGAAARAGVLLERFGLAELAGRKARDLSGGNKRRLHVALALVHRPRVLFLDEPTVGMDPEVRLDFWGELRRLNGEEGTTVFFTTQYLEEAQRYASELAILERGLIAFRGTVGGFIAGHGFAGGENLEAGYVRFLEARREAAGREAVHA